MSLTVQKLVGRLGPLMLGLLLCSVILGSSRPLYAMQAAQPAAAAAEAGGEANLILPDLSVVEFHGINGRTLLMSGLLICGLGLLFGLLTFTQLKNLPAQFD